MGGVLLTRFKPHLSGKILKNLCHHMIFYSRFCGMKCFFENLNWGCVSCWEAARSNDLPPVRPSRKCPRRVWVITPSLYSSIAVQTLDQWPQLQTELITSCCCLIWWLRKWWGYWWWWWRWWYCIWLPNFNTWFQYLSFRICFISPICTQGTK